MNKLKRKWYSLYDVWYEDPQEEMEFEPRLERAGVLSYSLFALGYILFLVAFLTACSWKVGLTTDGAIEKQQEPAPVVKPEKVSSTGSSSFWDLLPWTRNPLAHGAEDEKSDSAPSEPAK